MTHSDLNQLQSLPESIGDLAQLEFLYLGQNQLQSLPESIGNLSQLRVLNLYSMNKQCELFGIRWGWRSLVKQRDLSGIRLAWRGSIGNQLQFLPESIGNLIRLQELDLADNQLQSLPESIGNLTWLGTLDLLNNQLQSLPENIGNLTHLTRLDLNLNQLQRLPESIGNLSQLFDLLLSNNQLQALPESIGNLSQLWRLDLGLNQLQHLPESIGNLSQLWELDLADNQLQALPESIGNLSQLSWLVLSDNQLQNLPESIGNLFEQGVLDLSRNSSLTALPVGLRVKGLDITGCTRLRYLTNDLQVYEWLDLADTGLTELPPSLHDTELRWRGVRIDARIAFQPETITAQEILNEENVELRRVLLERMGYERFIREADAQKLDHDVDTGGIRRLLRIEFPGDEPFVALVVLDPSTGRQYVRRVPPDMATCKQAAAWVAGFDNPNDYCPLVET